MKLRKIPAIHEDRRANLMRTSVHLDKIRIQMTPIGRSPLVKEPATASWKLIDLIIWHGRANGPGRG